MNILIDTHILLWWLGDYPNLTKKTKSTIANPKNNIFVSSASVWEISIKQAIGKLKIDDELINLITECGFYNLPIQFEHAYLAGLLPNIHNDPFDRMLIAQSTIENFYLLSYAKEIKRYDVLVIDE